MSTKLLTKYGEVIAIRTMTKNGPRVRISVKESDWTMWASTEVVEEGTKEYVRLYDWVVSHKDTTFEWGIPLT